MSDDEKSSESSDFGVNWDPANPPSWPLTEKLEDLPLFMDAMPENPTDFPHVQALMDLKWEDMEPEEIANTLKTEGNAQFKLGTKDGYVTAVKLYSDALLQKLDYIKDGPLLSVLHSNRAAAHVNLGNYAKAMKDCNMAITRDPTNIKAYYRGASAALHVKKLKIAITFCNEGLAMKSDEPKLLALKSEVVAAIEKEIEEQRQEQIARDKELAIKGYLREALHDRGVTMGHMLFESMRAYDAEIYLGADGLVHYPLLFLYPEFGQSDFVKDAPETNCLSDYLNLIFGEPASWDSKRHYVDPSALKVYILLNGVEPLAGVLNRKKHPAKYVEVDVADYIGRVVATKRYIVPCFPAFYVVSTHNKTFMETWLVDSLKELNAAPSLPGTPPPSS